MNEISFQECRLFISLRSPFARRVRVALIEHGISFIEVVHDVLNPTQALFQINPLGRVPALELSSGEVLIDSNLILQVLYKSQRSQFLPDQIKEQLEMYGWMALFVGLMEKTVEYFLDSQRSTERRDPEVRIELNQIIERVLSLTEAKLSQQNHLGVSNLFQGGLTQADFDLGVALEYLLLRYPQIEWMEHYPSLKIFFMKIQTRESFLKTKPPH